MFIAISIIASRNFAIKRKKSTITTDKLSISKWVQLVKNLIHKGNH